MHSIVQYCSLIGAQMKAEMTDILEASDSRQLEQVRELLRSFVDWLRQRYADSIQVIDDYFDLNAYEAELVSLPGKYAPPRGRLLLALSDGLAAGCVALSEIDGQTCEMKRMFVDPRFQGRGIGRVLCEAIIQQARSMGYSSMRLETGIKQIEAQDLYRSIGFKTIKAYYEVPERLERSLLFMELNLRR